LNTSLAQKYYKKKEKEMLWSLMSIVFFLINLLVFQM